MFFGVFTDGAVGRKLRGQAGHACTHTLHPGGRDALIAAAVKLGDHFAFKQVV